MKAGTGIAVLWKRQWLFYVLTAACAMALYLAEVTMTKGWLVEWFNARHTPFLNEFFKGMTLLGNGWFIAVIIVLASLVRVRNVISLTTASLLTGVVVQILKRIVFSDIERPSVYFDQVREALNPIDGVALLSSFSFPSGHAAGAFALFFGLALLQPGVITGAICFLLAALAALSRVYLGQHFSEDILAGALIGVVVTTAVFAIILSSRWYEKPWARYSVAGRLIR